VSGSYPVSIKGVLLLDGRRSGIRRQSAMELIRIFAAAVLFATLSPEVPAQSPAADTAAVTATVRAFHQALAAEDSAGALRLLAADAVILEGGGRESRDEYAAHHLPEDIAFVRAVPIERSALQVTVSGDVAWVISTSTMRGVYRNRAIDSAGVELMVLSRESTAWVIRAIHWSSR
jgi:ketosteroid isomerase-like protein